MNVDILTPAFTGTMSVKRKSTDLAKAPATKKKQNTLSPLETRLNSILCCEVCLDLPPSSIVQVRTLCWCVISEAQDLFQ